HRLCRETSDGIVFDYDPAIAINVLASADAPQVDAWPIFDALTAAPLLIVRGELSDLLSETAALAMANRHRQAELVTVPATGHAPNLSEAEAMAGIERLLWRVRN
ncbi:MAG: alpha/beta fold hydrolase, partial [Sphingomicrobium sp.]